MMFGSVSAQTLDWDTASQITFPATEQGVVITGSEPSGTGWSFGNKVTDWGDGDGQANMVIFSNGPVPSGQTSTYTFSFTGFSNGGVSDLAFSVYGLGSHLNALGNLSHDDVTFSALDLSGNAVNVNPAITVSASPTYTLSAQGNNANFLSTIAGSPSPGEGDHIDPNTWANFDFNAENISSLTISYAPDIAGTGAGSSSGFALTDLTWAAATVPEPATTGLLGLAGLTALIRRRR